MWDVKGPGEMKLMKLVELKGENVHKACSSYDRTLRQFRLEFCWNIQPAKDIAIF